MICYQFPPVISTMGFYHKEKIIGELPEEKALRDSTVSNMVLVSLSLRARNKDSLKWFLKFWITTKFCQNKRFSDISEKYIAT